MVTDNDCDLKLYNTSDDIPERFFFEKKISQWQKVWKITQQMSMHKVNTLLGKKLFFHQSEKLSADENAVKKL